ncbi:unnamed protein product [Colias eurytheme]|nr:unnamed protein product [Colias eurytheme]
MKTSTILPFFMWRTNGTTRKIPKTYEPQLYQVVGTLFPPESLSSNEDMTTHGSRNSTDKGLNDTDVTRDDGLSITTQLDGDKSGNAFSPDDLAMVEKTENGTRKKAILRYGFHRTSECNDFEKAYLCIQKCLDFHYDIAYADRNCYCTCYVNKEKAKYSAFVPGQEQKWKLGAPTTKIPIWAQKQKTEEKTSVTYPDVGHSDIEDFHGNATDNFSSNNTQAGKTNATQVLTGGTELENVKLDNNSTNTDNSSISENAIPIDQNATTTVAVVGNETIASQNSTA